MSLTSNMVSELGSRRKVTFTMNTSNFKNTSPLTVNDVSDDYIICNAAVFQVRISSAIKVTTQPYNTNNMSVYGYAFIKFASVRSDDPLSYTLNISCDKWSIVNKKFVSDDGTWHLIGETTDKTYTFTLSAEMTLTPTKSIFEDLFNDDELADFELKGEGGSVKMHRAVLAGASPVLRRMLSGPWREAAEGSVDVTGTSVMTLNHFKEYIYLDKLPVVGLQQLSLLAHYYMMSNLENKCIFQLLSNVTAQNACDLVKFGAKHDMTMIVLAILDCVQRGALKVEDMRAHLGFDNILKNKVQAIDKQKFLNDKISFS